MRAKDFLIIVAQRQRSKKLSKIDARARARMLAEKARRRTYPDSGFRELKHFFVEAYMIRAEDEKV